jgi:hypothetical protein
MFKSLLFVAVLFGATACHNYSSNVGEVLGCTLAGNGCDDGRTGPQGLIGLPGNNGADGADGSSCSVSTVVAGPVAPNGGAQIICDNGSSALILNGAPGTNGLPAPATPYSIANIVTPCPNVSGSNKEVLLVLQNRAILASVSENVNGKNTRLSLIGQGSFQTTDGRACAFSVSANAISWSGGSASY